MRWKLWRHGEKMVRPRAIPTNSRKSTASVARSWRAEPGTVTLSTTCLLLNYGYFCSHGKKYVSPGGDLSEPDLSDLSLSREGLTSYCVTGSMSACLTGVKSRIQSCTNPCAAAPSRFWPCHCKTSFCCVCLKFFVAATCLCSLSSFHLAFLRRVCSCPLIR